MLKTRIALAIGVTAITGAGIYAADQYFTGAPAIDAPIRLAVNSALAEEAAATDCGLKNNVGAERDEQYTALAISVSRARVIASEPIPQNADIDALVAAGDCRLRIDGVWVEDLPLALDTSVIPEEFSGFDNRIGDPNLMHSTYVTPEVMLIDASEDGQLLNLRNGRGNGEVLIAEAVNSSPLADIFKKAGEVKEYRLTGSRPSDDAGLIEIDMPIDGTVRIRIGGSNFYRPAPKDLNPEDISGDNPFMLDRAIMNLGSTRQGYNVVTQDMWNLGNNGLSNVFAPPNPADYAIEEARVVPVGYRLMPEIISGTLVTSSMMRSQEEFQRTVSWNVGAKVGGGQDKATGTNKPGVGAKYTQSQTKGMMSEQANSIMHGLTRHKSFTVVLDEPFARLSKEFVIAVEDARRRGRYDELIQRFGTHYPYAITYGSAGLAITEFSEETVSDWQAKSQGASANAQAAIKGVNVGLSGGGQVSESESQTFLQQASYTDWRAVGGTGGSSIEGHSTGTPAPILADLRPIHELLNPLNFPGEPEIYTEVREQLRDRIEAYMETAEAELSARKAKMNRKFKVTPARVSCTRTRKERRLDLYGWIDFRQWGPQGRIGSERLVDWEDKIGKRFKLNCEKSTKDWASFGAKVPSYTIEKHPDEID
ncbi:MAG: MAC/perforin domain-containing protein, partial [Pseudomonadota bacterium]